MHLGAVALPIFVHPVSVPRPHQVPEYVPISDAT